MSWGLALQTDAPQFAASIGCEFRVHWAWSEVGASPVSHTSGPEEEEVMRMWEAALWARASLLCA